MTLLTIEMQVRWNGSTRKHYEARGYIWGGLNNWFAVKIEDVIKTTPNKVEVECDYCSTLHEKQYRVYFKGREIVDKDCCSSRKCMVTKSEEVNLIKYGVKNIAQLDSRQEEMRKQYQTPIDEIISIANSKGLTILNKEDYQNKKTRLKVICNNHPEQGVIDTNSDNIKRQKHCCNLGGIEATTLLTRHDGNFVYQEFIKYGLIPLFQPEEYETQDILLPYMCVKHEDSGIQYKSYNNLKYTQRCAMCGIEDGAIKLRKDETQIFDYFLERGLSVEEGEKYKNKDTSILCRCIHHPQYVLSKTASGLENTLVPCEHCRNEKSLTELNRILRSTIANWRKESEIDCNYRCILTGSKEYEVHHLYSFNSIIKDCLNELNIDTLNYNSKDIIDIKELCKIKHMELLGVCIRADLHLEFHRQYTKVNNTPQQFNEFKKRFLNGEFKNLLREKEVV